MKHLLRAMGAAMLAALLLSACSTPQEQTEPSAPQTTQATQAATGATEESATEAEELLALPRDLGSGLTLIIYLYSLGLDPAVFRPECGCRRRGERPACHHHRAE